MSVVTSLPRPVFRLLLGLFPGRMSTDWRRRPSNRMSREVLLRKADWLFEQHHHIPAGMYCRCILEQTLWDTADRLGLRRPLSLSPYPPMLRHAGAIDRRTQHLLKRIIRITNRAAHNANVQRDTIERMLPAVREACGILDQVEPPRRPNKPR